jgi:hypothetical protein
VLLPGLGCHSPETAREVHFVPVDLPPALGVEQAKEEGWWGRAQGFCRLLLGGVLGSTLFFPTKTGGFLG